MGRLIGTKVGWIVWTVYILLVLIFAYIVWTRSTYRLSYNQTTKQPEEEYPLTKDTSFLWIFPAWKQDHDNDSCSDTTSVHEVGPDTTTTELTPDTVKPQKPRKVCKHGKLKKIFSRKDPNNPYNRAKQRGFFTLADFQKSGVSLKEGYTAMTYPNLVAPFDNTYNVAVANANSTFTATQAQGAAIASVAAHQDDGLRMQCGTTCTNTTWGGSNCYTQTDGCSAINQGLNSTQVFNVDFSDPNGLSNAASPITQTSNVYQPFCSNWGVYSNNGQGGWAWGGTIFAADQYNTETRPYINDCLYNQRQSILQTCNVAQANLNEFWNNVVTNPTTFQNTINSNIVMGQLNGGLWSWPGNGTEQNNTNSFNENWTGGQWDQGHWIVGNMLNEMQSGWSACNNTNAQILSEGLNNCTNQQSQIDINGMTPCGLSGLQQETQAQCQLALGYAQSANDTKTQAAIQALLNYDPLNPPGQTLQQIQQTLQGNFNYCLNVYNQCSDPNTLLDPSGLIICAGTQLSQAYNTCEAALDDAQSQSDAEGETAIENQWNTTVADNLVGNSLTNVNGILANARAFCAAQVAMYNKWETEEQEAADTPCTPEQPIMPSWEPGLTNQVQTWNTTSLNYLTSLQNRLQVILTYLQNTPNCLTFDPSNVSILPPGSLPVVTITGNPPNQVLNMSVPEGNPGPQGPPGNAGGVGNSGNQGAVGATGKPGIWEVPQQYVNTFSSS